MRPSDRLVGAVVIIGAVIFAWTASKIPTSFLSGPVGSGVFPMLIAGVAALAGLVMIVKPEPEPGWPEPGRLLSLALAVVVMAGYAYLLKPAGFLLPTAVAAAILSWQINPKPTMAALTGVGLSIGLYLVFRYGLGLGLSALPRAWGG